MSWNKTDRSFKTLINKRTTDSDGKFFFNEKGDNTINAHFSEIWSENIPIIPPASSTSSILVYDALELIEDLSVPNKNAWFATLNSTLLSAQTDESSRLKNWISDKYGSGYEILLYDTNDIQIPPSDGSGWFFDYQTGILTFASSTTTTGPGGSLSSRAPFKIKGYRFIGRTGFDSNIIKNSVVVASSTSTSFSGWTYSDSNLQIDTDSTASSFILDGISLSLKDRILIKNWNSNPEYNGIYQVIQKGNGVDSWIFERAPDANNDSKLFVGMMVYVEQGTEGSRTIWVMDNKEFTGLHDADEAGELVFQRYTGSTAGDGTANYLP